MYDVATRQSTSFLLALRHPAATKQPPAIAYYSQPSQRLLLTSLAALARLRTSKTPYRISALKRSAPLRSSSRKLAHQAPEEVREIDKSRVEKPAPFCMAAQSGCAMLDNCFLDRYLVWSKPLPRNSSIDFYIGCRGLSKAVSKVADMGF